MKEATGELNMTIIVIIAAGIIIGFLVTFLPDFLDEIGDDWREQRDKDYYNESYDHDVVCFEDIKF